MPSIILNFLQCTIRVSACCVASFSSSFGSNLTPQRGLDDLDEIGLIRLLLNEPPWLPQTCSKTESHQSLLRSFPLAVSHPSQISGVDQMEALPSVK
jgi:hypothetical protein